MDFKASNFLVFAVLLGGAGHVMVFQDGYWNDFMWMTAALSIIIPVLLYKYVKISEKKRAKRKQYADI